MSTADPLAHTASRHQPAPEPAARDPLCGMSVDPATTLHRGDHAGLSYYFCSARGQDA